MAPYNSKHTPRHYSAVRCHCQTSPCAYEPSLQPPCIYLLPFHLPHSYQPPQRLIITSPTTGVWTTQFDRGITRVVPPSASGALVRCTHGPIRKYLLAVEQLGHRPLRYASIVLHIISLTDRVRRRRRWTYGYTRPWIFSTKREVCRR